MWRRDVPSDLLTRDRCTCHARTSEKHSPQHLPPPPPPRTARSITSPLPPVTADVAARRRPHAETREPATRRSRWRRSHTGRRFGDALRRVASFASRPMNCAGVRFIFSYVGRPMDCATVARRLPFCFIVHLHARRQQDRNVDLCSI